MKYYLFLMCSFIIFLGESCVREEDEEPPVISIIDPVENKNYQIDEDITIEARVTDNRKIERVTFRIRSNESNNIVLPQQTFSPNKKEADFKIGMEITDTLLKSGLYYIEIEADDGANETSSFRFIRIEGLAKKKLALLVTTSDGNNATVYADKNNHNYQPILSFPYSFGEALVNNDDQHFWFLPGNHNELFVYDLRKNFSVYTEQYNSNFSETFVGIGRIDRVVYVGRKAEIDGFSERFTDKFTYLPRSGNKVNAISVTDDFILAAESDLLGGNGMLNVLGRSSGISQTSIPFPDEIIEMFQYSSKSIIIFYNTASGGAVADFRVEDNAYRHVLDLGDSLHEAIQITNNEYLTSDHSIIMRYRINTETANTYSTDKDAVMHYDTFSASLYVGAGKQLLQYAYPQTIPTNVASFNENIKNISVRFNRN